MSDPNSFIRNDPKHGLTIQGKLTLCDNEGRPFCVLGSDSDGGFIHLLNKEGGIAVSAGCDINSGFVDVLFRGEPLLAVTLTNKDDKGFIELNDKQGNIVGELPTEAQEENVPEKIERYREIIKAALLPLEARQYSGRNVQNEAVFDTAHDRYLVMSVGWEGTTRRIHGCILHLDIINGKVWIQRDGTEDGIADALEDAGILKSDIVPAFHSEGVRP